MAGAHGLLVLVMTREREIGTSWDLNQRPSEYLSDAFTLSHWAHSRGAAAEQQCVEVSARITTDSLSLLMTGRY